MIAFKYSKTDGAEFLSHLDLLRHVYRTLRRARIPVSKSGGYHAHARIFLNNPLAVGVKSVAEYAAADTDFSGDFKEAFNSVSPLGVKCLDFKTVDKNPNFANGIDKCSYIAEGLPLFDVNEILSRDKIVITDLRGRETDIRPRIHSLEFDGNALKFTLGCGTDNLRPDLFISFICGIYGGSAEQIIKTASFGKGVF